MFANEAKQKKQWEKKKQLLAQDMRVLTVSSLFFSLQDVSARRCRLFESSSDG